MGPARWRLVMLETAKVVHDTRKLFGWSQDRLVRKAGVSQGAISRLESGHATAIPFQTIVKVISLLGAGVAEIGLEVAPPAQGLFAFVSPSLSKIARVVDLDFAQFAMAYHRCTPQQRQAVSQFLVALTSVSPESNGKDIVVPPGLEN